MATMSVHISEKKPVQLAPRVGFKNILVATDFSSFSDNALRYAMFLAAKYQSRICLAHAFPPFALATGAEMRDAKRNLQELLTRVESRNIECEAVLGEGAVGETLLKLSRDKKIDLIITGTHG